MSLPLVQRQFFVLLILASSVIVFLQLFQPTAIHLPPPVPIFPRLYATSECGKGRRLGNIMFTYAALLGIAQQNNVTPVIDRKSILVDVFKLSDDDVLLSSDMVNTMSSGPLVEYRERGKRACTYDQETRNLSKATGLPRSHVYLRGYYQSWRYFDKVVDKLRRNFRFRDNVASRADDFLSRVLPSRWRHEDTVVRVGVHVRRGDMASNRRPRDYGYTTAPPGYFLKAMTLFVRRYKRVQFVVCSDDIAWCKANIPNAAAFGGDHFVDVVFSTGNGEYVDLAVLARCRDVIVSVGSFGWWAAWLANGTVVYYADWPRPFSMLDHEVNKTDYFPSHWIALS